MERTARSKSVGRLLMCEVLYPNSAATVGRHFKPPKQQYLHFTFLEFSLQILNILFSNLKLKKKQFLAWLYLLLKRKQTYSVEIPRRCSFVIEFIIPKFFKGSTCFEQHTAHRQEL